MAKLFQHILVPVDFTKKNETALHVSETLAKVEAGSVTLLHVIETIDYEPDAELERFYDMLRAQSSERLTNLAGRYKAADVPVECVIQLGKRAGTILEFAQANNVDLVVMSSHRVNLEESPKGWGTVSHQVSILAQCPVLLVK